MKRAIGDHDGALALCGSAVGGAPGLMRTDADWCGLVRIAQRSTIEPISLLCLEGAPYLRAHDGAYRRSVSETDALTTAPLCYLSPQLGRLC